jgi:hypothetical protein
MKAETVEVPSMEVCPVMVVEVVFVPGVEPKFIMA